VRCVEIEKLNDRSIARAEHTGCRPVLRWDVWGFRIAAVYFICFISGLFGEDDIVASVKIAG